MVVLAFLLVGIFVWFSGLTWAFRTLSAPCTLGGASPDALVLEWIVI